MAVVKDRIIVGNSYSVKYQCVEPTADGSYEDTEIIPSSAYVELWDVQDGDFITLGAIGPNGVGANATIAGNEITYTVPTSATATAGDYKLFVTAVFSGSRTVTEVREFKVLDKQ